MITSPENIKDSRISSLSLSLSKMTGWQFIRQVIFPDFKVCSQKVNIENILYFTNQKTLLT